MLTSGSVVTRSAALSAAAMLCAVPCHAQATQCNVRPTDYKGWAAQEVRNEWVTLTFVPQLGGRLMQVTFGPHSYLFVNPQYEGKYLPPLDPGAPRKWYNYGGDKIWPLPEGEQDEHHWPGPLADPLDDGDYKFSVLSQGSKCKVRLDGPADPRTGLQYSREISLEADSPVIFFHAVMKNASARPIEWSVQSVTQYNTAALSGHEASAMIWGFMAVSERSNYSGGYFVQSGNAPPPGLGLQNGLVQLNYHFVENELWFDTKGGWLAVADDATQYAMVERFPLAEGKEYPGKATIIFYTNGPSEPPEEALYYMEAEINSPIARLQPGETYAMDTAWYPTRAGKAFLGATEAGVIAEHLHLSNEPERKIMGAFGVFFSGKIVARSFDKTGRTIAEKSVRFVTPLESAKVEEKFRIPRGTTRIAIHLIDVQGNDRGVLDEVSLASGGTGE